MNFFTPGIEKTDKAEEFCQGIRKFVVEQMDSRLSDRRVFSLTCFDSRKDVEVRVGKREPFEGGMGTVLAIFYYPPRNLYLVCTANRGDLRGMPYWVGGNEVRAVEDFEV